MLNSVAKPKGVPELEEMILTMMAKIEELAYDNKQLKLENAQLKRDGENLKSLIENTVEDRLQYLEAITRQISEFK